jgi:hypothetical protein
VGRTVAHDVALAESWGYPRRDAVRIVARYTLLRAEEGVSHPVMYLRDLHQLMIATA